jgi:ParB/RepB/Spo0J family partition protein
MAKAKLTDEQRDQIKRLKAENPGITNAELAENFGVHRSQISRLLGGKSFSKNTGTGEPAELPFSALTLGPNPRTSHSVELLRDLAGSILDRGVLQNLVLFPARNDGLYEIDAGQRRYLAIQLLINEGKLPPDYPVPVRIRETDKAGRLLDQLAENIAREPMNPMDEAEAFRRLVDGCLATADIAAAVGRTQRHVQSRIKLARRLSDRVKTALRAGTVTLAQAEALCDADAGQQAHVLDHLQDHTGKFPTEQSIRVFLRPPAPKPEPDERRSPDPAPVEDSEPEVPAPGTKPESTDPEPESTPVPAARPTLAASPIRVDGTGEILKTMNLRFRFIGVQYAGDGDPMPKSLELYDPDTQARCRYVRDLADLMPAANRRDA